MPKDVCARNYLSAVQRFDRDCGSSTCLRQIHFVDVNDDMINVIQQTFTQNWITDVEPNMATKSSGGKPSQSTSAQEVQKPSDSGRGSPSASTATGNSFQSEREPRNPVLKIFPRSSKGEDAEYQFQFPGLDLVLLFRLEEVADIKTEAVVLWQEIGNVGKDENSKQLRNSLSSSAVESINSLELNSAPEGHIQCTETDSRFLVFPVISPYSVLSEEKVRDLVERSISKVDMHGKRSVTIPAYPHIKGRFFPDMFPTLSSLTHSFLMKKVEQHACNPCTELFLQFFLEHFKILTHFLYPSTLRVYLRNARCLTHQFALSRRADQTCPCDRTTVCYRRFHRGVTPVPSSFASRTPITCLVNQLPIVTQWMYLTTYYWKRTRPRRVTIGHQRRPQRRAVGLPPHPRCTSQLSHLLPSHLKTFPKG